MFSIEERDVDCRDFTGWLSVSTSETWSFAATGSRTSTSVACLGPHGWDNAPEPTLKWNLWFWHRSLCTDCTHFGCEGYKCRPVPQHLFSSHTQRMVSGMSDRIYLCLKEIVFFYLSTYVTVLVFAVPLLVCLPFFCRLYQWICPLLPTCEYVCHQLAWVPEAVTQN